MAILVDNKKVHFDYEVIEKFEAGLELLGFEVKSLKKGQGSLEGAYVIIRGGEAYAMNIFVPPYQEKNTPSDYDPRRNRRLILSKKEIRKLSEVEADHGLTVVPISIYNKFNLIKVTVAIVRGKRKYDKRETIRRREVDRDIRRDFRDR